MKKFQISRTNSTPTDQSVATYLSSIQKIGMISPDEEAELARRIHLGDKIALDKLVCANLRFVVSVAKQFQNRGLDLADLIEEGNIGLCKAAERFDETQGFKFITFAVNYIQQAIMEALTEKSRLIRLPHGQIVTLNKIKALQERYRLLYNRIAAPEEIAEELDLPLSTVKSIIVADSKSYSLDASLSEDSDDTLQDIYNTESDMLTDSALEEEDKAAELDMLLRATLTERDIYIIRHSFGIGCEALSQLEIASNLGLSRERVRQLRDQAIHKLRSHHLHQRLRLCC